ncbi:hypothetical protein FEM48_Zijuj05G0162200 [Ziziphus jujuba var. spinosa]|uniref:Uncharacterized protein n=1 Tax=Ziziphus jujuba var. spinosa TaxID=714518 RepID=A0A978VFT7_ZIZJJ|nr:hypothetical protein FEM48_Zijuj05G0162200 [Ziziphus jujuba var. spinosa]
MENRRSNNSKRGYEQKDYPIHSQVRKIIKEDEDSEEEIMDWLPRQSSEMRRPALREITTTTKQISPSPLGISGSVRPISV